MKELIEELILARGALLEAERAAAVTEKAWSDAEGALGGARSRYHEALLAFQQEIDAGARRQAGMSPLLGHPCEVAR